MNDTDIAAVPPAPPYRLDWFAGASAVIDVTTIRDRPGQYSLRYGSPFRPTMRAPADEIPVGDLEFNGLKTDLKNLAGLPTSTSRGAGGAPAAPGVASDRLAMIGRQLATYVLPEYATRELRRQEVFVEIGTDEGLVALPWELLHDGEGFLALRHSMGRFVNLSRPSLSISAGSPAADLGALRMLIVAVPRPLEQEGKTFDPLPGAEAEAASVMEAVASLGVRADYLVGRDATVAEVRRLLLDTTYHIIHFTGHATFQPQEPRQSALVLHDGSLRAGALTAFFTRQKGCVLCFINACETTQPGQAPAPPGGEEPVGIDWDREYDIFGLARSFLESGAYLLGSRWLLPDRPAATFASTFYDSLLGKGEPIGMAIRDARKATNELDPDDVSWASYIYYGDPRVCFRRVAEVGTGAPGAAPEGAAGAGAGGAGAGGAGLAGPPVAPPVAPVPVGAAPGAGAGPGAGPAAAPGPVPRPAPPAGGAPAAEPPGAGLAVGPAPEAGGAPPAAAAPQPVPMDDLRELARRYQEVRDSMGSGPARTAAMTEVVYEVGARVADAAIPAEDLATAVAELLAGSPGERIVGFAILEQHPDARQLPALLDAIENIRTPFEQYQALTSTFRLVPLLNAEQATTLQQTLRQKLTDPEFFGTDRSLLARSLLAALGQTDLGVGDSGRGNPSFG